MVFAEMAQLLLEFMIHLFLVVLVSVPIQIITDFQRKHGLPGFLCNLFCLNVVVFEHGVHYHLMTA